MAAEGNYLTVGDFLEDRYGQSVRVIIASLIWFGALFILAGQLLLGAAVFSVVAGLPKWAGVLIGGAAMTGYFSAGGLLRACDCSSGFKECGCLRVVAFARMRISAEFGTLEWRHIFVCCLLDTR